MATEGGQVVLPSTISTIDAVTVIQISGAPGRAYRIRPPRFATAEVHGLVQGVGARGPAAEDLKDDEATSVSAEGRDVIRVRSRLPGQRRRADPLSIEVE